MMSKNLAVGDNPGDPFTKRGTFNDDIPDGYTRGNRESILSLLEFHENEQLYNENGRE